MPATVETSQFPKCPVRRIIPFPCSCARIGDSMFSTRMYFLRRSADMNGRRKNSIGKPHVMRVIRLREPDNFLFRQTSPNTRRKFSSTSFRR